MKGRGLLVALVGAALAVALIGVMATHVGAQEGPGPGPVPVQPSPCSVAKYDINKDGRLTFADLDRWKRLAYGSGTCKIGAESTLCPQGMDVNGDGKITLDDVQSWLEHFRECLRSRRTDVG